MSLLREIWNGLTYRNGPTRGALPADLTVRRVSRLGRVEVTGLPSHLRGRPRRKPDALDLAICAAAALPLLAGCGAGAVTAGTTASQDCGHIQNSRQKRRCEEGGGRPVQAQPASRSKATAGTRWDTEQVANAALIVDVGRQRGVPRRGHVVALATAMQESSLRNDACCDHDSLGLFQQRPSQGWGTPAQVADPRYAAGKFYERLAQVPGWQSMPVTRAAQAVQRSAYPDEYAKWESDAEKLAG